MNRAARPTLVTAAAALLPLAAQAHAPMPGIGHFYNGAFHPFLVVPHLLALISLGLWTGQRGVAAIGGMAAALAAGLLAGLGPALAMAVPDTDLLVLAAAGATGLAVAVARPLPQTLAWLFAAAVGLAIGLGSAPDGVQGMARWAVAAGTVCGATLALVWTAAMASFARPAWTRIALRVLGSWISASALLVLALSWAGPR